MAENRQAQTEAGASGLLSDANGTSNFPDLVIYLKDRPCKIFEVSSIKAGDETRLHIYGWEIFSMEVVEDEIPQTQKLEAALVTMKNMLLVDIPSNDVFLLETLDGREQVNLKLRPWENHEDLKCRFREGEKLIITLKECGGEQGIASVRRADEEVEMPNMLQGGSHIMKDRDEAQNMSLAQHTEISSKRKRVA